MKKTMGFQFLWLGMNPGSDEGNLMDGCIVIVFLITVVLMPAVETIRNGASARKAWFGFCLSNQARSFGGVFLAFQVFGAWYLCTTPM